MLLYSNCVVQQKGAGIAAGRLHEIVEPLSGLGSIRVGVR